MEEKLNGNDYGKQATIDVLTTKDVDVYKVTTGHFEAENKFDKDSVLLAGSKVKISEWKMSTGSLRIVSSSRYQSSEENFYAIYYDENDTTWFKEL
ncbi:hypothetical protein ACXDFG_07700 [Pediococcus pentosaceus]